MRIFKKVLKTLKGIFQRKKKHKKVRRRARPSSRPRKLHKKAKPAQRPLKKKKAIPKVKAKVKAKPAAKEVLVGEITHYFSKIMVCVIKMKAGPLNVDDRIHIKGGTHDFTQAVKSLQIESVDVKSARRGQLVGLKTDKVAREGCKVYKILS